MFDTTTFLSIWYWALAISLWSEIGSISYGVSARMLADARKLGGEDAELADRIGRRHAARLAGQWAAWGPWAVAGASGGLAMLATLAFSARSEMALGMLLIAAPTAFLTAVGMREVLLVHKHQPAPDVLLDVMITRRRVNVTVGFFAIAFSALVFAMTHISRLLSHFG